MKKIFYLAVLIVYSNNLYSKGSGSLKVGEVIDVNHPCVKIDVKWDGEESFNCTYSAPDGFVILEIKEDVKSKRQFPAYSFTKSSTGSEMAVQEDFEEMIHKLKEVSGKDGVKEYKAKIEELEERMKKVYNKVTTTHSTVTVSGTVKGDDNWLKQFPGRLYMDLKIKLMRVLTPREMAKIFMDYRKK